MKKIFLLLAAVGMIFTACEPANGLDEDNNGNNTEQPGGGNDDAIPTDKIVIKPSTITVEAAANSYIVAVSSPCSWRATTEEDWITLETGLGIDGKQQLIFAVKDYLETEPREGKIVVSNSEEGFSAELTVVQKAFVPEWSVEPESLTFVAEGETKEVFITANFSCECSKNVDWITVWPTSNGISVTARKHMEVEERSAYITISSKKYNLSKVIKVTQTAFVPEVEITETSTSYECDYKGGKFAITVTANFDYDVTTTANWIAYDKNEGSIQISVGSYKYENNRTAEVKIYSKKYNLEGRTITITQTPPPYPVGSLQTIDGAKGVVFYFDDTVTKIVSVTETQANWYDAKTWCSNYGTGWYLPSRDELGEIISNASTIDSTLSANGYTTFAGDVYWSSTEYYDSFLDCNGVWSVVFGNGSSIGGVPSSNDKFYVRAVLAFEN